MKQLNSKGFSAVEAVLILVIAGIIGGTGYYVYSSQKKTGSNDSTTTTTAQTDTKTSDTKPAEDTRKTYSATELAFTFKYPADWTATVGDDSTAAYYSVNVEAPGTTIESTETGNKTTAGAQIRVLRVPSVSFKDVADFKAKAVMFINNGKNKKDITIDGRAAVQYDISYEGSATHDVVFFDGNSQFNIGVDSSAYAKADYAAAFEALLKSIDFK